jgi:transcriptional regulator with XRE-family HTH domain
LPALDAESVREWRNRRMLSRQDLADLAGTSPFTIRRIERGEGSVRPQTGRAVARALGVDVEAILPKAQAPLPFEESTTALQTAAGRNDMETWAAVRACIDVGDVDGALDALRERIMEMFPEMRHQEEVSVEELMEGFMYLGEPLRARPELSSALLSPSPTTSVPDIVHLAIALSWTVAESAALGWRNAEIANQESAVGTVVDQESAVGTVGDQESAVGTVGDEETAGEALRVRSVD